MDIEGMYMDNSYADLTTRQFTQFILFIGRTDYLSDTMQASKKMFFSKRGLEELSAPLNAVSDDREAPNRNFLQRVRG